MLHNKAPGRRQGLELETQEEPALPESLLGALQSRGSGGLKPRSPT